MNNYNNISSSFLALNDINVNNIGQLLDHGIGEKDETLGYAVKYGLKLTFYTPNDVILWDKTLSRNTDCLDFCIDNKNGILFYISANEVVSLSLKTGEEMARASLTANSQHIECSPKYKKLYVSVQTGGISAYGYDLNFINSTSTSYVSRVSVNDKLDRVIITQYGATTGYTRILTDNSFNIISRVQDTNISGKAIVNKPLSDKISAIYGATVEGYTLDDITTKQRLGVASTFSSTFASKNTNIMTSEGVYFCLRENSGNPTSSFTICYIDFNNSSNNYKSADIAVSASGVSNNTFSVSQDAKYVYVAITPRSSTDLIKKKLYRFDKTTRTVSEGISFQQQTYIDDAYIKVLTTYDLAN